MLVTYSFYTSSQHTLFSPLPSDLNTRETIERDCSVLMEKHKCDVCLKRFINGRVLSGHMRSHHYEEEAHHHEIDFETSVSLSSEEEDEPEEEEEEEEEEKDNLLSYGLRENPKKSIRLVDQEFSFAVEPGSGSSVILQDRESETESSKNPIRRRSKRIRRRHESPETARNGKKTKIVLPELDPEPVSSISYTSPDEDVAYCLMMLKRDKWVVKDEDFGEDEDEFAAQSDGDESDSPENNSNSKKILERKNRGGRYKCETCHKVFRSYQALGGHRASHKKIRMNPIVETNAAAQETDDGKTGEEKIHECPVCYRVFNSGQALGGHKRSHVIGSAAATATAIVPDRRPPPAPAANNKTTRFIDTLIDLNLPAPMEDDDVSQIEFSAVSDR